MFIKTYLFLFYFICLIFISCKKDSIEPSNQSTINSNNNSNNNNNNPVHIIWNERFIGQYKGTWSSQWYLMGQTGPILTKDTTLIIGLIQGDTMKNTINLSNCQTIQFDSTYQCYIYHGAISVRNDSLFYGCMNGGLGGGTNESFKGKKL